MDVEAEVEAAAGWLGPGVVCNLDGVGGFAIAMGGTGLEAESGEPTLSVGGGSGGGMGICMSGLFGTLRGAGRLCATVEGRWKRGQGGGEDSDIEEVVVGLAVLTAALGGVIDESASFISMSGACFGEGAGLEFTGVEGGSMEPALAAVSGELRLGMLSNRPSSSILIRSSWHRLSNRCERVMKRGALNVFGGTY